MVDIVTANEQRRALRAQLLTMRQALASIEKQKRDELLRSKLDIYVHQNIAVGQTIALYTPIRGEPELLSLAQGWIKSGYRVVLPVVREKNAPLEFVVYQPDQALKQGAYGILEPTSEQIESKIDAAVIPCVGFNPRNYRLGYGGGYYDRTLTQQPVHSMGVAYDFAKCDFIENEFDVVLNTIVVA